MDRPSYRPDIDGLRAVAVISVVAFHVGVPGFGGGFVGVDIFFVISGFLITTLLLGEIRERGSVDLLAFYARRARRLLPAFFVVVAATLLLGAIFLAPIDGEQDGLANSAVAAALYFSNLHFALASGGYFDGPSELMPLLHTWSLAVEEQFYVVWPLLLLGCAWAAGRDQGRLTRTVAIVLAVVVVLSLGYSWLASRGSPDASHLAFFILPSRAWELALGASLALALPQFQQARPWLGASLSAVGIVATGVAAVKFKQGMAFPGVAALLPVAGAAALIAGGALAPRSAPVRLLSSKPMVAIGLLSYSWYLWHWPLLAIARAHELGVTDVWRDGALAILAFGLAWLTFVYVEQPIRTRKIWGVWTKIPVLGAGAAASLMLVAGALALSAYARELASSPKYERIAHANQILPYCKQSSHKPFERLAPASRCMLGPSGAKTRVVLWGDSHAKHLAAMIDKAGGGHRLAVVVRSMAGCLPLFDVIVRRRTKNREGCALFNAAVLAEIDGHVSRGESTAVVLSARWSSYLRVSKAGEAVLTPVDQSNAQMGPPAALTHGLATTIRALTERGVKVLVTADVPDQRFSVPGCLARKSAAFCSVDRNEAKAQRAPALRALMDAVGLEPEARSWDPFSAMCDEQRCHVERDGTILYVDDNHLSWNGALWLAPAFAESAAWLAGAPSKGEPIVELADAPGREPAGAPAPTATRFIAGDP